MQYSVNKQEVYQYLNQLGIWHEITAHPAVYSMAEVANVQLPYPSGDAKNLLIRDDKHAHYYLLTVKGDRRVDLKKFRQQNGTRRLSFASAEDLQRLLGVIPGAVTPLGLLNDQQHQVVLYLDHDFLDEQGIIGVHPNENTATVWLRAADLVTLLQQNGTSVKVVEF